MRPVGECCFIIIFFYFLHICSVLPWECKVSHSVNFLLVEIIFHMALCTYKTSHLLVGCFGNIHASCLEGFNKSRTRNTKVHCPGIVAVGTAYRIDNLRSFCIPGAGIESCCPLFFHQPGNIWALAGPACVWLGTWNTSCPKCVADVFNCIIVTSSLAVLF